MTKRDDILLTDSEELQFLAGDFLVGVSDQQHVQHILKANKGHYYQSPLIGLGSVDLINGDLDRDFVKQQIKLQLKSDNYQPLTVDVDQDFNIFINAEPLTI
tara:strand:- start:2020 stop:2325 length:306 start_codon:yes stop_codon:yes gene_type:complete